jgi:hypothetical protein
LKYRESYCESVHTVLISSNCIFNQFLKVCK